MLEYLGEIYMSICRHFFLLFKKLCQDQIKLKQTEDLSNMLHKDENIFLWCGQDCKNANQQGEKV